MILLHTSRIPLFVCRSRVAEAIGPGGPRPVHCGPRLSLALPLSSLVFTARCYASAVLAMALCPSVCLSVCPSVRPSVRPSQAGVLLKRLNVGSHKQHHTIAQRSNFMTPKISAKFDRGRRLRGRRMQVGWVKIGDF